VHNGIFKYVRYSTLIWQEWLNGLRWCAISIYEGVEISALPKSPCAHCNFFPSASIPSTLRSGVASLFNPKGKTFPFPKGAVFEWYPTFLYCEVPCQKSSLVAMFIPKLMFFLGFQNSTTCCASKSIPGKIVVLGTQFVIFQHWSIRCNIEWTVAMRNWKLLGYVSFLRASIQILST